MRYWWNFNILYLQKAWQHYKNLYFPIHIYVIQVCFLVKTNVGNSKNKNHHYFFMLFLLIKLIIFLLKNNVILLHFESLKKWLVFHALSYVLKCRLRAIFRLFFSDFFQSCFSYGEFIPSQLYLSIKGLVFIFW